MAEVNSPATQKIRVPPDRRSALSSNAPRWLPWSHDYALRQSQRARSNMSVATLSPARTLWTGRPHRGSGMASHVTVSEDAAASSRQMTGTVGGPGGQPPLWQGQLRQQSSRTSDQVLRASKDCNDCDCDFGWDPDGQRR